MRIEAAVTSISWIPSEAVAGATKVPFESGIAHYDPPPPDVIGDLEELRQADRFRFANQLKAWVEVKDGRIVDCGQSGRGLDRFDHARSSGPSGPSFRPSPCPTSGPRPGWP